MKILCTYLTLILFFLFACSEKVQQPEEAESSIYLTPDVMCGTVQFSDGCSPEIDSLIQFGFALIHHMTYDDAEYTFQRVIDLDDDCFWGHWGRAMTYIHPLWPDVPNEERMRRGQVLAGRAMGLAKNKKEELYGKALFAYFENGSHKTEKERLSAFRDAWDNTQQQRPDDLEARLFHALIKLALVSPGDKSYKTQREVGAIAESVLEVIPDHPGGFHYAIHAYDHPPLADHAKRVALNYSKIAPEIPHALHMPTHIFTRLGYWKESIEWNVRSANAAWKFPANGEISLHYFHALDYLAYAYIQKAEDEKAALIQAAIDTLSGPFQPHAATVYALAAIPARLALERQQWEAAADLDFSYQDRVPWDRFPQYEALIYFAKGIGAGRSGQAEVASAALDELKSLHSSLEDTPSNKYWRDQIGVQITAVQAWWEYARGEGDKAIETMALAAEQEDATDNNPVSPGELLPVREMLGDLLMEKGEAEGALEQYRLCLERSPKRFNSMYGAAKAAQLSGDLDMARTYFAALLDLAGDASSDNEKLKEAAVMAVES